MVTGDELRVTGKIMKSYLRKTYPPESVRGRQYGVQRIAFHPESVRDHRFTRLITYN